MPATESTEAVAGPFVVASKLLGTNVENVASDLILIFSGLAAVGLLSMVFVNLVKSLLEPRFHFNRYFVRRHIGHRLRQCLGPTDDLHDAVAWVERRIVELTTGGEPAILFRLPAAELVSQIKIVTGIALSWPENLRNRKILDAWTTHLEDELLQPFLDPKQPVPPDFEDYDELTAYVSSIIDSNLAGLQLRMEYGWRLALQTLSILLSVLIIWFFLGYTPGLLLFSVVGGMLAPFSHDFVTSLRKISTSTPQ